MSLKKYKIDRIIIRQDSEYVSVETYRIDHDFDNTKYAGKLFKSCTLYEIKKENPMENTKELTIDI